MNAPPPADPFEIIKQGAISLGIPVDDESVANLVLYMKVLDEWRHQVNLTAISGVAPTAVLHFLDSLTVFKVLEKGRGDHLLDVGTGAGFPGVVLRIADRSMRMTLMDRDPKKIVFLKYLVRHLELDRVQFLNTDLKSLTERPSPAQFTVVVSRAFSSTDSVLDGLARLLSAGGSLIRMAGPSSHHKDLNLSNFERSVVWEGVLPFSSIFRQVTLYKKL